jgi:hypothetical protein
MFQLVETCTRAVSVVIRHLNAMMRELVALDFAETIELDPDH